ncbi:diguanylate cyclase [Vibrio sp.]|nr:diguanylate cyclase [Vibrio sp.]
MIGIRNFYILIFLSLAGWMLFAYFTMGEQIEKQNVYAELINKSGKQRMLSQRTALLTMRISQENNQQLIAEKSKLIAQMVMDHEYLVTHIPSVDIHKIYFSAPYELNKKVRDYIDLNSESSHIMTRSYVDSIINQSSLLLPKLDFAVSAYQKESEKITQSLRQKEQFILLGSLITLLIEYLFIFIPTFRKIRTSEAQIIKTKEKFERLVKYSPDGSMILSLEGKVEMYSDRSAEMLGYSYQSMPKLTIFDWDTELASEQIQTIINSLSTDKITLFESKHKRQDGSVYDALVSCRLIDIEGDRFIYASVKDVTSLNEIKRHHEIDSLKLKAAAQSANLGIWQWNPKTEEMLWDDQMYKIFDVDHPLNFAQWKKVVRKSDREQAVNDLVSAIENKTAFRSVYSITVSDGSRRTIQASANPLLDSEGNVALLVGTNQDITDRRRGELEKEQHLKLIDKNIITSKTDLNGVITEVSQAFSKVSGFKKQELIGKRHNLIRHPDTPDSYYKELWEALKTNQIWKHEIKNRNKSGEDYWLKSTYAPVYDEFGEKIGYSEVSQEITDKKRAEELSIHDQLTGLYNRLHIDEVANSEIEREIRYGNNLSFMMMDLDHFKRVNDTYGHLVGDEVLVELANILNKNTRRTDCVGRWGGEEFIVICPNTNLESASMLAEKLRTIIEEYSFPTVGHLTSCFGVTQFREGDKNKEALITRADTALYQAKEQGRNRVVTS